jgi:hypothetical protein
MPHEMVSHVRADDDEPLLEAVGNRPHRIKVFVKPRFFLPAKLEAVQHNEIGYAGIAFQEGIERVHSA